MDSMEEQAPTLLHRWSSKRCRYILTLRYTINLHFSCVFISCYCFFSMDGHYKEYMITLIRYGIVLVLVLMTNIHEWSFLGVWFHFSFSFTHTHMTISFLPWCFMFIFLTWGKHFLVLSSFMTYHQVTILTRRVPLVEQKLLTLPVHLWSPPVFSGVRVTRTLVLCVCFVDRCLAFCPFSFGHCVVCSSIYGFWLPLWHPQTLLETNAEYLNSEEIFEYNDDLSCYKRDTHCYKHKCNPNRNERKLKTTQTVTTNRKWEELGDTKGVIRIRKSEDRQHNGENQKDKQLSTKYCTEN